MVYIHAKKSGRQCIRIHRASTTCTFLTFECGAAVQARAYLRLLQRTNLVCARFHVTGGPITSWLKEGVQTGNKHPLPSGVDNDF